MKKRAVALLLVLCLTAVYTPDLSRAAITPYFMAINDTLLEFSEETMPFVSGGTFFVPSSVFAGVDLWAIWSEEGEWGRFYSGVSRFLDFHTKHGETRTVDQDGNILNWPPARRIGSRFYLPLNQVCEYFDLTWEAIEVQRDIIPEEQMYVVRIVSSANFNGKTFVGLNRNEIRAAYNTYYAPPPQAPSPGEQPPPPPVEEPPPDFNGVTINLSFFDISAGNAEGILDMLDTLAASGYYSCFFVSAEDIVVNPALIRRIAGSGHTIGILLEQGTYSEYQEASALLFEAAKIRTVIVTAGEEVLAAGAAEGLNGLRIWENSRDSAQVQDNEDPLSVTDITDTIPADRGARLSLMLSCSDDAAAVLPGVIWFLLTNELNIERIIETVLPV